MATYVQSNTDAGNEGNTGELNQQIIKGSD